MKGKESLARHSNSAAFMHGMSSLSLFFFFNGEKILDLFIRSCVSVTNVRKFCRCSPNTKNKHVSIARFSLIKNHVSEFVHAIQNK